MSRTIDDIAAAAERLATAPQRQPLSTRDALAQLASSSPDPDVRRSAQAMLDRYYDAELPAIGRGEG